MDRKCLHCNREFEHEHDVYRCYDCGAWCHRSCLMLHCADYRRYTQYQEGRLLEGGSLPSHLMANAPHHEPSGEPVDILNALDKDTVYEIDVTAAGDHGHPVFWHLWYDGNWPGWRASDLGPDATLRLVLKGYPITRAKLSPGFEEHYRRKRAARQYD